MPGAAPPPSGVDLESWRARARGAAGGDDPLVRTGPDGVEHPILTTAENGRVLPGGEADPGVAPYLRGAEAGDERRRHVEACSRLAAVPPEELASDIEGEVAGGCDALWIPADVHVEGAARDALAGVWGPACALHLDLGGGDAGAKAGLADELGKPGADPAPPPVTLWGGVEADRVACTRAASQGTPALRTLGLDGFALAVRGARPVTEAALCLSLAVRELRSHEEAGIPPEECARHFAYRLAVGRDQLAEIARLRAMRWLHWRVLRACGVARPAPAQLHAVCSPRELAAADPEVNALRVSGGVFAAIAGGAQAVTAWPFDALAPSARPSPRARRLARNTVLVLRDEARLADIDDPLGGSHHIETHTRAVARAIWREFRALEAAGGVAALDASGELARRLEQETAATDEATARGERPLLGVTHYPPPGAGEGTP